MTAEGWVEVIALALAVYAAVLTIPRPAGLDWERLFKMALATSLRGEIEAEGGDASQWWARMAGTVPYHPAGATPEATLAAPEPGATTSPAERALVEALAALPDPAARWRHMYVDDPEVQEALRSHPADLGPDYDPVAAFEPGVTWDHLATWTPAVRRALARRLEHVVVAGVCAPCTPAMGEVSGLPVHEVQPGSPVELARALLACIPAPSDRLVVLAAGDAVHPVLAALHDSAVLRDKVCAVVSLGGRIRGNGLDPWLDACFTHPEMDTEMLRAVPYLSVVDVDPAAPLRRSWSEQRFPSPPVPPSGRATIESIDLGPLVLDRVAPAHLARALWVVLAFRLSAS